MGITSALYSGVTGLNATSQALSVIGNNLANTTTTGYKSARTTFSDLLSSTISAASGSAQVGRGVSVSSVDYIFSQGTFETTSSGLDVAIEGDSFFMISAEGDDTMYYTRDGSFSFDDDGYLVTASGLRVQGKYYGDDGEIMAGDPADIQIESAGLVEAQMSSTITFNTNLDAEEEEIADAFDYTDEDTYNYSSSCTVYDSLGESHLVTVYFVKDDAAANTWNWYYTSEQSDGTIIESDLDGDGDIDVAGSLVFDTDGNLETVYGYVYDAATGTGALEILNQNADDDPTETAMTITIPDWGNDSELNQALAINFDTTQYDSDSQVISVEQDGYASGNLTSVDIDDDGAIVASYSNGTSVKVANLVLAKFTNTDGLLLAGSNMYEASDDVGEIRVGLPGDELGTIYTYSLEQSTVDTGTEFVSMITVQRAFQANSTIITTVDELLEELINLKR